MRFYSKYANLRILVGEGKVIRFENGVYDATPDEAKLLEQTPSYGVSLWQEKQKIVYISLKVWKTLQPSKV